MGLMGIALIYLIYKKAPCCKQARRGARLARMARENSREEMEMREMRYTPRASLTYNQPPFQLPYHAPPQLTYQGVPGPLPRKRESLKETLAKLASAAEAHEEEEQHEEEADMTVEELGAEIRRLQGRQVTALGLQ